MAKILQTSGTNLHSTSNNHPSGMMKADLLPIGTTLSTITSTPSTTAKTTAHLTIGSTHTLERDEKFSRHK